MKVKYTKTEDFYPVMKTWWKEREFTEVSPSILPEGTFVCHDDSDNLYSICFYHTDSHLAWVGWPISNPFISKERKEGAFKFLFDEVERYAREAGYHCLFTTTPLPVVKSVLEECGYKLGDEKVDHYLKVLV